MLRDDVPGHRPSLGDGENAWCAYAQRLQGRLRKYRGAEREAGRRAAAAEARALAAEDRARALRERGDEFHELLQREESALRHERRAMVEVERLLTAGDAVGALELLTARRRRLVKIGVLS